MIMLLYDMKFRITSFDMIESSPCVLFFPMYFLVSTQKTEANFEICNFDNWRRIDAIIIFAMESL